MAGYRELALLQGVDSAAGVFVQLQARFGQLRPTRASLEQLERLSSSFSKGPCGVTVQGRFFGVRSVSVCEVVVSAG